ncbi:TRAP-type C4-dicarboxylate transport system substrate-binding protein [Rhodococcus rhodochrous J45]|uniref:TRAP-type C4-dicarboxylate transport system substrate-binding protein n=1 Tax=Rhodococcus rhodochrous J45 TaxID=935266 RepID=A0A562DIM7_RHORH|nr:TRAP-type C4-dicarboxylate transport system substrate-binding protein [Rhodococcus rhodochrous J45]
MKYRRGIGAALVAVAALLLSTACGSGVKIDEDGTITLRIAHYMPNAHYLVKNGIEVWMDEVQKRTDGQVEFEYYPAGQLVSAEEMLSSVQSGVVHVGAFVPASSASAELPLTDVLTVPGFPASSTQVVYDAYWDVLQNELYDLEWKEAGIRPALGMVTGRYQFLINDEPRHGLQDWSGHTIRSVGGAMDFVIQEFGSASVNIPGPEEYEALQRGLIDSAANTLESLVPYRFNEVITTATTNMPIGASVSVLAINQEVYDELPVNVQQAMDEASEVAMQSAADATTAQLTTGVEETKDDVAFYELTDQELADLSPALTRARDRWIAQREKNGDPGQQVVDAWQKALEDAEANAGTAPVGSR